MNYELEPAGVLIYQAGDRELLVGSISRDSARRRHRTNPIVNLNNGPGLGAAARCLMPRMDVEGYGTAPEVVIVGYGVSGFPAISPVPPYVEIVSPAPGIGRIVSSYEAGADTRVEVPFTGVARLKTGVGYDL